MYTNFLLLFWIYLLKKSCSQKSCLQKENLFLKKIADYTGGLLLHYNYFIGADFDDTAVEYKWVTNALVDSTGFLSNYPVTRVTGHCLMWSDLDLLRDYPCSSPLPSICEIPMGAPTAPTAGSLTFLT